MKRFGPIADYLSEKLAARWSTSTQHLGGYQSDMQAGAYDIVSTGRTSSLAH